MNANALPIEFPKCLAQSKTIPLNSTNLVRWDIMKAAGKRMLSHHDIRNSHTKCATCPNEQSEILIDYVHS